MRKSCDVRGRGRNMVGEDRMREFVALSETLSYTKAAELTYVAQPTLSRHVAALEKEMGTPLVVRSTTSVRLTEAGQCVAAGFKQMMELLDTLSETYESIKDEVASIAAKTRGIVRIASPYYWTGDFTEPLIAALEELDSRCDVEVISCQPPDGYDTLQAGRCDAFVAPISWFPDNAEVGSVPFATEGNVVVMDCGNPLATRDSISMEDLDGQNLIQLKDEHGVYMSAGSEKMRELLAKKRIKLTRIEYTPQIDLIGALIRGTDKIAVVSRGVRNMQRDYLRYVPFEPDVFACEMCVIYRLDNDNPALAALVEAAKTFRAE